MSYGELTWVDNDDPGVTGVGNNCAVDVSRKIMILAFEVQGLCTYLYTTGGILTHKDRYYRSGLSLGVCIDYTRMLAFEAANIKTGIQARGTVQSYSYDAAGNLTFLNWNDATPPFGLPYLEAKGIDLDINWRLLFVAGANRGLNVFSYIDNGTMEWKDWDNTVPNIFAVCVDTINKIAFTGGGCTYKYDADGNLTLVDNTGLGGNGCVVDMERQLLFVAANSRGIDSYSYDAAGNLTFVNNLDIDPWCIGMYGIDIDTYSKVIFMGGHDYGIVSYSYTDAGILSYIHHDDQGGLAYGACVDTVNHVGFLANWNRGVESYSFTSRPRDIKFILDSGVVYKNYVSPSEMGTRLGVTKAGSTFIVEQEMKDIVVDGAHGPVEGSKRIISIRPKLTINFIEISQKILNRAFPGSDIANSPSTHKQFSRSLTIDNDDYLTNVVLVAQMLDKDDPEADYPIIVGVENAIANGNVELSFLDKEESGCTITFAGHFESDNLDLEPWFVHLPLKQ